MLPVAIIAGGLATRLHPVTETIPKALIEVAGRPFVLHQLALLQGRRVVMCVGHLGEQVEAVVGDGTCHGVDVVYSYDGGRAPRGAGPAQRCPSSATPSSCSTAIPPALRLRRRRAHVHRQPQARLMTVFGARKTDASNVRATMAESCGTTRRPAARHDAHRLRPGRAARHRAGERPRGTPLDLAGLSRSRAGSSPRTRCASASSNRVTSRPRGDAPPARGDRELRPPAPRRSQPRLISSTPTRSARRGHPPCARAWRPALLLGVGGSAAKTVAAVNDPRSPAEAYRRPTTFRSSPRVPTTTAGRACSPE